MSGLPFAGKVALVTGGGRGIGRETARLLGMQGAHVFICGRSADALEKAVGSFRDSGMQADSIPTDIRDPEACRRLVDSVRKEAGRLDVLINNAGMSMRGSWEEAAPEVIRAMAEINYLGTAYVTQFALPLLRESRGSVVFISSLSALHGLPFVGPYGASKLALKGLAESLRAEVGPAGVHVGLVHVSFTENDPGKVVYGRDGSLVQIGARRNSNSQRQVARGILRCVRGRKRETTLSLVGHLASFAYRFFPGLSDALITRYAGRSGQYGSP
jgi:NAD(P)-dependent dehydrogenase (short-subunit alcohol dehydrogenase family)